jgi:hypothetical protein
MFDDYDSILGISTLLAYGGSPHHDRSIKSSVIDAEKAYDYHNIRAEAVGLIFGTNGSVDDAGHNAYTKSYDR